LKQGVPGDTVHVVYNIMKLLNKVIFFHFHALTLSIA